MANNENTKVKDNTDEIMRKEQMVISFNPKQVLKRLAMIIIVILWIISVEKPGFFTNIISKTKEKKVEVKANKEIVMVEKIDDLYVTLFDDNSYVSSDNLAGLSEKMSESTGKTFAAEDGKLKMIDGGLLTTVDIATYRR